MGTDKLKKWIVVRLSDNGTPTKTLFLNSKEEGLRRPKDQKEGTQVLCRLVPVSVVEWDNKRLSDGVPIASFSKIRCNPEPEELE